MLSTTIPETNLLSQCWALKDKNVVKQVAIESYIIQLLDLVAVFQLTYL